MRWAAMTIIALILASLIAWVRGGESFHIAQAFPFLGGQDPGIYDAGGLVIIFITVVGLGRLARRRERGD